MEDNKCNVDQYRELLKYLLTADYMKIGSIVSTLKVFTGYAIDLNVSDGLVPVLSELMRSYAQTRLVNSTLELMQEFSSEHELIIQRGVPYFCKFEQILFTVHVIGGEMLVSLLRAKSLYVRHVPYEVATICRYLHALAQKLNLRLSRVCFYFSELTIRRCKMEWVRSELTEPIPAPVFYEK